MRRNLALIALAGLMLSGPALGQECAVTIEGNDQIQFVQSELRVSSSCTEATLTLVHIGQLAGNIMGHNWVLSTTNDWQAVAQAGQASGPPNYAPEGDERVIAATAVIGGGEEVSITFDISGLEPGGDYTYFCSFPGHFVLMNGNFIIE
ncbi:azurin [Candidatus Rariloculus sp.]|uniref:azurin n=1 Tax=Candidatus Rariloculus sp. TaxID=3101265 RepID=UPI003D0B9F5B